MMRKLKLYIAASLNGKIATTKGEVDWLDTIPNPEGSDYGYSKFYDSIDTTIQGYKTYKQLVNWDIEFPYKEKTNYVFTRKQGLVDNEYVSFVSGNHIDFVKNLKKEEGKDIWLIGGGQVNTMLFNAGLIDEVRLFIMPLVLSGGIELFEPIPVQKQMELIRTKSYSSGVVELIYQLEE